MIKVAVPGTKGKMSTTIAQLIEKDSEVIIDNHNFDVLIDFTQPEGTMEHLELCLNAEKPIVIGTTGFTENQYNKINETAGSIPILISPNMSLGVNVVYQLITQAAAKLKDWHIEISEKHHINKKDKPSGTAKKIQNILSNIYVNDIKIQSTRKDELIGEHSVIFSTPEESLEITHKAESRTIYAIGAISAAKWLIGKKADLYDMQDVIGCESMA